MSMTGSGLAAARKAAVDAVPAVQTSNEAEALAYSEAILLADSTAIVQYIQGSGKATGTDSNNDTHELSIV